MTATVIRLADHRKPLRQALRREVDPLMLWLDGAEFMALATIAPLFGFIALCRVVHERRKLAEAAHR